MAPFCDGFNCLKVTVPVEGDSLIFTTKSPGVESTLEPPSGFEPYSLAKHKKVNSLPIFDAVKSFYLLRTKYDF